jgi:hypothetical protein
MKPGLVARDIRLLVLVLVLGLVAVVLVVTSWPRRAELARPSGPAGIPALEVAPAGGVPAEGRRVARRFAKAYFAWSSTSAARREKLEPYSTDELIAEMRVNSGALALPNSGTRAAGEAEVVALQSQDGTEGNALVAIIERTTKAKANKSAELVTVTLELVEHEGDWLVAEVLVP